MGLIDFYAGREDKKDTAISGLEAEFADRLYDLLLNLPPELAGKVTIKSAYRDVQHQQELWDAAVKKYGSPEAARKWVAPPGKSNHGGGLAVDLSYATNGARKWVHENAARFGLNFPMAHENWHIEPIGVRSGEYKSTGHTHGDGDAAHVPAGYAGADPDAYTDDQGLVEMNNNSLESQLLRVADYVTGGRSGVRNLRTVNARAMADQNSGRLNVEAPQ